jgi:putative endonuclease
LRPSVHAEHHGRDWNLDRESDLNPAGREGEELASRWLERNGFRILATNWRNGRSEIDIVAREKNTIAFVEVKTRRLGPGGPPADAVSGRKRDRLARGAAAWIALHPGECGEFRFDIIEIVTAPGGSPLVEHRRDAFHADAG